jgi:uncharacterized protein YjbI with pentapeptide repeats
MEPEELEKRTKRVTDTISGIEQAIRQNTEHTDKVAKLSMLSTGGKVPDYSKYSDQDLRDVFDLGMRFAGLNNLPIVSDPNTGLPMEGTHKYSTDSINNDGLTGNDLSRKDLIEAIDSLLKHNNYNIDPIELAKTQDMMMDASVAQLSGYVTNVNLDNINLEEEQTKDLGQKYKNQEVSQKLKDLKKHLQEYEQHVEKLAGEAVTYAIGQKLDSVRGGSPEEVAKVFDLARQASDNRNRSDAMDQLDEDVLIQTRVNLSDLDLDGVDLSESDLSGIKVDPESLAMARGIESVKGVSPNTLDLARSFQTPEHAKIVKYEAQLDKLNKPGFIDYIKSIRHGGIEGARQHLIEKIDRAKIELTHKMDPELSRNIQERAERTVDKLERRQDKLAPTELEYQTAKQSVKGALVMEALNESVIGGGLSQKDLDSLKTQREEGLDTIAKTKTGHEEHKMNEKEIEGLKKDVSVRQMIGNRSKGDGGKPGQSVGL